MVVIGFAWIRQLLHGKAMEGTAYSLALGLGFATLAYDGVLLAIVRRAGARNNLLPAWLWAASAVFESLIPTVLIFILQSISQVGKLDSLDASAVLLYGIFIIASILRLRPWISALSGGLAALGHLALFLRVFVIEYNSISAGTIGYFLAYPAYLLLSGIIAAVVSRELRKHLLGALGEADAKNALEMVENELVIARTVQQALMPNRPPDHPGFDIAGWNRPASKTGGDYYDWQVMPDGRLAVVIADVTGHGPGPAILWHFQFFRSIRPPRRTKQRLDARRPLVGPDRAGPLHRP